MKPLVPTQPHPSRTWQVRRQVRRQVGLLLGLGLLGAGGLACDSPPDFEGDPASFTTRVAEVDPTTLQWVVGVTGGDRTIARFAVAGDYIYFAAREAGLYRARKNGGAIEVVDAGMNTVYNEVAAGGQQVYWLRTTVGQQQYPHVSVRHQVAGATGASTRFEGDWGTLWSDNALHFQADGAGVYLNATPRGTRVAGIQNIPAEGGVPIEMLAIRDIAESPTWVVDASDLFFTICKEEACQVAKVSKAGGAPTILSILPAAYAAARAVSTTDIYLNAPGAIWRVTKQGSEPQVLYPVRGSVIHPPMVIDDSNLYFLERREAAKDGVFRLRSIPTGGGNVRLVATGTYPRGINQMAQDDQNIYLLHGEAEIIAIPKPQPLPPAM
jgi:hypothetical protein